MRPRNYEKAAASRTLLLATMVMVAASIRTAHKTSAGTSSVRPAPAASTAILVANSFAVTSYAAGRKGNAIPVSEIADMEYPRGIASDGNGKLYVLGSFAGSDGVAVYASGTKADVPLTTIIGSKTGLFGSFGIATNWRGTTYVANAWANSITVYAPGSSGNVAPIATIAGDRTGLVSPEGLAVDPLGNIYVADGRAEAILVFSAKSRGNTPPLAIIGGGQTGLSATHRPHRVIVDSGGRIYVAFADAIMVYSAGSNGNTAPIATVAGPHTGLRNITGISLDSAGRIYAANAGMPPAFVNSLLIYPPNSRGDVSPITTIAGQRSRILYPVGVAVDRKGNIYVAGSNGTTMYPAGSSGDIAPAATITGHNTGLLLSSGLALDFSGKLFVTNEQGGPVTACGIGTGSVTVYAPGSFGNAVPEATIAGVRRGISYPQSVAVDSAGNVYVANSSKNINNTLCCYRSVQCDQGVDSITVYSAAAITNTRGNVIPKGQDHRL